MQEHITLKSIWELLLEKKSALIWGQIVTVLAIFISIPIPLMLPILVDEVLLGKPALFVNTIDGFFGSGSAFYYIAVVGVTVIFLRFIHFLFSALITKIFTSIAKYVTYKIREKLIAHLKQVCMNEYESIGSGAIGANLVTDVNTLDSFIITGASRFIASVMMLIAIAVVMMWIHPMLGLMILVLQPLVMLISKRISRSVSALKANENAAIAEFQDTIGETLELFGQIKASNKCSSYSRSENNQFTKIISIQLIQRTN